MNVFVRPIGNDGIIATKDNGAFVSGRGEYADEILSALDITYDLVGDGNDFETTDEFNMMVMVEDADYCK